MRRFKCYDDSGHSVDSVEYVAIIEDPSFEDPDGTIEGLHSFRTAEDDTVVIPIGVDLREFEIRAAPPRRVKRTGATFSATLATRSRSR